MPHLIGNVSNIIFNMNIHEAMRGFRNYVQYERARYRMTSQKFIIANTEFVSRQYLKWQ